MLRFLLYSVKCTCNSFSSLPTRKRIRLYWELLRTWFIYYQKNTKNNMWSKLYKVLKVQLSILNITLYIVYDTENRFLNLVEKISLETTTVLQIFTIISLNNLCTYTLYKYSTCSHLRSINCFWANMCDGSFDFEAICES